MSNAQEPSQQPSQIQRQQQVMKVVTASWKKFSRRQKTWLTGWMLLILFVALIPSIILWFSSSKEKSLEESNSTLQAENVSLKADNSKLKEELQGFQNLAATQKQPSASSEGLSLAQVEDAVAKICGPKEPPKVAKAVPAPAKKVVKKVTPSAPQNVAGASQQPQVAQIPTAPAPAAIPQQPAPKPEKWWVWHHPAATAASPAPCIFAVSPTTTLPPQCNAVKAVVPVVSGENGLAWSERVSGWGNARKTGAFQPFATQ